MRRGRLVLAVALGTALGASLAVAGSAAAATARVGASAARQDAAARWVAVSVATWIHSLIPVFPPEEVELK